jgi:hypothetical protein
VIRGLHRADRRRRRAAARRQWRPRLVPLAIVQVEGRGRSLIVWDRLETRWSQTQRKRLWRIPDREGAAL